MERQGQKWPCFFFIVLEILITIYEPEALSKGTMAYFCI